jgi:hypothetical protein
MPTVPITTKVTKIVKHPDGRWTVYAESRIKDGAAFDNFTLDTHIGEDQVFEGDDGESIKITVSSEPAVKVGDTIKINEITK